MFAVGLLIVAAKPAFGVSKETLRMMQQLDALQQMVQDMQKTINSQTAVLRTLIEQANENVNSMKVTVADLRKSTERNLASTDARFESMTNQIQALSESLEEAKSRLAKLSDQMAQTQNIIQTINTPPPPPQAGASPATSGSPAGGDARVTSPLPDADTLFKSGISYFSGGQYPLAIQAFQEYLQHYGDTERASTAQYYIGECYYSQEKYADAIREYDKCLDRYPNGNKLPAAQLKKGFALLAMDRTSAGVRELRSLVQRFPSSREADLARQQLKKLGVSAPGGRAER